MKDLIICPILVSEDSSEYYQVFLDLKTNNLYKNNNGVLKLLMENLVFLNIDYLVYIFECSLGYDYNVKKINDKSIIDNFKSFFKEDDKISVSQCNILNELFLHYRDENNEQVFCKDDISEIIECAIFDDILTSEEKSLLLDVSNTLKLDTYCFFK